MRIKRPSNRYLNWIQRVGIIFNVLDIFPKHSKENVYYNALALCGEAGELANVIKKDWRGDGDPEYMDKVAGELADVFISAWGVADALGLDIDTICDTKSRELVFRHPEVIAWMRDNGHPEESYRHIDKIGSPTTTPQQNLDELEHLVLGNAIKLGRADKPEPAWNPDRL